MPYFNGEGDVIMGIGDGIVSINGKEVARGGFARWLSNTNTFPNSVIYQSSPDYKVVVGGNKLATGCTGLAANNGSWSAWLDHYGYYDSTGALLPKAGVRDVGLDGTIVFCPDYQSGRGLQFPGYYIDALASEFCCYDKNHAVWKDERNETIYWDGVKQNIVNTIKPVFHPRLVYLVGKYWILYNTNESPARTIIQPVDADLMGIIVKVGDNQFNPDVFAFSVSNMAKIAWSTTSGERPQDLVVVAVDLTQPLVSLSGSNPIPTPNQDKPMIKSFERPIWMGPYFSFHERYGDTPIDTYTGNAITVIGDERDENVRDTELARIVHYGMPMLVDIGTHAPDAIYNDLTVAWLAAGGTIDQLIEKVEQALEYAEKPIIAYLDGRNWPVNNPFNSDRVWPSIQAYRMPGESLQLFDDTISGVLNTVSEYNAPLCLVPRFDDFNGSVTIESVLECMPLYEDWVKYRNIAAFMPFADRRGNGIAKNPSLYDWAKAFYYALPLGRPNRYDYWRPSGQSIEKVLENKFGQTRACVVMEEYLRDDILAKYNNTEAWPNLKPLLDEARAKYGATANNDQCVAILNETAYKAGNEWGLFRKEGGNHGVQAGTDIPCSIDILVNKKLQKWTDCIVDAGGASTINWPPDGQYYSGDNFVEPVKP